MVLGVGGNISYTKNALFSHLSYSTWVMSIPMVSISILYGEEIKELLVHADHLYYFGVMYSCVIEYRLFYTTVQQISN